MTSVHFAYGSPAAWNRTEKRKKTKKGANKKAEIPLQRFIYRIASAPPSANLTEPVSPSASIPWILLHNEA
jgi:hypothetical protein